MTIATESLTVQELHTLRTLSDMYHANAKPAFIESMMHDANLIEGKPCKRCGEPLQYDAITYADSYRAFAVCEQCNTALEF